MKTILSTATAVLILVVGLGNAARAEDSLDFDVVTSKSGAQPIAIAPLVGGEGLATDVSKVVEDDLMRSGQFSPLTRDQQPERPSGPTNIDYRLWRDKGMPHVVVGSVKRDPGSDRSVVNWYLLDVNGGSQMLGLSMAPAEPAQLRYTGHQIADLVFEKLTGSKGIFSTKIAYVQSAGYGLDRTYQMMISDWDGENPISLAKSKEPLMSPQWSPDRKKLAFVGYTKGRSSIFIYEFATGKVKPVVSEKGINGSPAWSPDGTKLAVTLSYESNPDIYIIDLASGAKRRLTTSEGIDTEPSFSPDGQTLVFSSERGGPPQVYKISVNGGDPVRLTFQGRQNLRPSFSPDGSKIVLVNLDGSSYRIALLDVASGRMDFLTEGRGDEGPSWAPNGLMVIYATQGPQGAELATVTIDGRARNRLRQKGDVREPAWSPLQAPK